MTFSFTYITHSLDFFACPSQRVVESTLYIGTTLICSLNRDLKELSSFTVSETSVTGRLPERQRQTHLLNP